MKLRSERNEMKREEATNGEKTELARQAINFIQWIALTPQWTELKINLLPPCRIHSIALISSGVSGSKLIALNWIAE